MSDDLHRLMRGIEGEGPSPEFRARLRAQIVAETDDGPAAVPEEAEVIDLRDIDERAEGHRPSRRPLALVAAVAAAVVLIVGLWTATRDEASGPDVTTETPEDDDALAIETLTTENTSFEPGEFRIDTLGTAFTFRVDQQTGARVNDNGIVSLAALPSADADDRTITLRRTNLLPDPSAPTERLEDGDAWPANDVEGWVARLDSAVVEATEPVETVLGGFRAHYVELAFACNGGSCRAGDLFADPGLPTFTPGSSYRLWVVEQGDQDPIVVTVAVGQGRDPAWFDTAATILDSLTFESIEPNPVRQRAGGPIELDAFDGIRLELPGDARVVQVFDDFARIIPDELGSNGDIEFLTRPLDPEGGENATTDRLLALLANEAVAVTELDAVTVDDQTARVFDVESGPFPSIVLQTRPEDLDRDESGWESPQFGRLWVIEHPQRGLLILSAEAFSGSDAVDDVISWAAELVASLEFR